MYGPGVDKGKADPILCTKKKENMIYLFIPIGLTVVFTCFYQKEFKAKD
jgi:hypothetical protein